MRRNYRRTKSTRSKIKLGLPELEYVKTSVINSLRSLESQRSYQHSINEFVDWYCSSPRLSLNKAVVTRYRIHLEDRHLAPGTINVRLAAVRRLAYEATDSGLLSPDLAAGIRRVKGAKKLGFRIGNWLTVDEARQLWQLPDPSTLKGKRDRAILAVLLGCGLRRRELTELSLKHIQRREDHWAIVDLVGKAGHVRTVPMPDWVKRTIDLWLLASSVADGRLFRRVCRTGSIWGDEMTEKVVWYVVKQYAGSLGLTKVAPHDLRRSCARLCHASGGACAACGASDFAAPEKATNSSTVTCKSCGASLATVGQLQAAAKAAMSGTGGKVLKEKFRESFRQLPNIKVE